MGLFNKNEEKEEVREEVTTITELDKLLTHIRRSRLENINNTLITFITSKYIEGVHDYNKCKEFIDICIKYEKYISPYQNVMINELYNLFINIENSNIVNNLIGMVIASENVLKYLDYMYKSRAYFTDTEAWAARVYEVYIDEKNIEESLKEDKMRIGIYPDITDYKVTELSMRLDSIKSHTESL